MVLCVSLFRYTKCWLPLAGGSNVRECVGAAPPLDVHWVWLVHMLAPQHYHKDCVAVTGRSVPHILMTTKVGNVSIVYFSTEVNEELITLSPWP